MSILEWYAIIAASGALTSVVVTYLPALKELRKIDKEKNIVHTFVEAPVLSAVVWFAIACIALPLIVNTIVSKRQNILFIEHITKRKYKP